MPQSDVFRNPQVESGLSMSHSLNPASLEPGLSNQADNPTREVRPWIWWIVSGLAAFGLYRLSMAPGLLWGDSGEAQLHILTGGWLFNDQIVRSHVLYYAIARTLRWILSAEPAVAANLTSVIAGAVTMGNVAWLLRKLCTSRVAAACGIILLAVSHTFWQLSTSAEVVTLSTALLTAEWIGVVQWLEKRQSRWLVLSAVANGLGLSNHNFAMLMWPVYGLVFLLRRREAKTVSWREVALVASAWLLGAAPILVLSIGFWREHGSLAETAQSLLVGRYGRHIGNLSVLLHLLGRAACYTFLNFPTPLLLLAALGLLSYWRTGDRTLRIVLVGAAAMYAAFGASYGVADQHAFLVPAFVLAAVFVALGLNDFCNRRGSRGFAVAAILLALLGPLAYALAPRILTGSSLASSWLPPRIIPYRDPCIWFLRPWRNGYDGAERFAREVLEGLPPDAWLVADSTVCPPINYLQARRSLRRDVRLISSIARQPWLQPTDEVRGREAMMNAGRLFATSDARPYLPDWLRDGSFRFDPAGYVWLIKKSGPG